MVSDFYSLLCCNTCWLAQSHALRDGFKCYIRCIMKRVKRSLSEVSIRQRRRRIAEAVHGELENCLAVVDNGRDSRLCASGAEQDQYAFLSHNVVLSSLSVPGEDADESRSSNLSDFGTSSGISDIGSATSDLSRISDDDELVECEDRMTPESGAATQCLEYDLRVWAINSKLPASHLNSLLKVLKPYHPELPSDARTLLKTQRHTDLAVMTGGRYHYFGISRSLEEHVAHVPADCRTLSLIVNVDGLPLSRSSRKQFWPILVLVKESSHSSPFVAALYEGDSKPGDVTLYLSDFVSEIRKLLEEGLMYNGKVYAVKIHAFVCDAPARAYIKCIKGHTAYFGCERCTQKGAYSALDRKIIFDSHDSPLRTDEDFRSFAQEHHHHSESPLQCFGVGMVTQFPLDYMHLVCLGVMKKLLICYWASKKPSASKMSSQSKLHVSTMLASFNLYVPSDMKRRPRSLQFLEQWKVVEFRNFLLYYGPLVLQGNLERKFYDHFMKLSAAIAILACPDYAVHNVDLAEHLLQEFVAEAGSLYGKGIYVYNVHSLLHLADDARRFGPLDDFSAFVFENFLYKLKTLVRTKARALQQVIKRLSEKRFLSNVSTGSLNSYPRLSGEHSNGPVPPGFQGRQYSLLEFEGTVLKLGRLDNCVQLKEGHIVLVTNMLQSVSGASICGHYFTTLADLYSQPLPSSELLVFAAKDLSQDLSVWPVDEIRNKCMCLPSGGDNYAVFPLLHTCHGLVH